MQENQSYNFRDIIRILFTYKIYFIVFPVLLTALAYIGAELNTSIYKTSVKMFIKAEKKIESNYYEGVRSPNLTTDHSHLINSTIVLGRVVDALKLYERPSLLELEYKMASPIRKILISRQLQSMDKFQRKDKATTFAEALDNLSGSVSVSSVGDSNLFYIHVVDFAPVMAVKIANSVSRSYVIFDLEQQVEELKLQYGEKHSTVLQLEHYIEDYKKYLDGELIENLTALGPASIKIVEQAQGASLVQKLSESMLLMISFFTGIFLAILFSAITEYFRNTFRTSKDIVSEINFPFLGSIPKRKKNMSLVMSDPGTSKELSCVKSYQSVGDKICLISQKQGIRTFLVTSFKEFSDSSAVIANLAIYLSREIGKKVLIIDANLEKPKLAKVFGLNGSSAPDLMELFEKKLTLNDTVIKVGMNLSLLTTQPVHVRPILFLGTEFMSELLQEAKKHYDLVFVDCSVDLRFESDPIMLSSYTDAVITIINEGIDRIQDVQIAINRFREKDKIIFTLFNNRKEIVPDFIYKKI